MTRLPIPNTGDYLYVNDIVILAAYPGTRYVVRNGWYYYNGISQYGWYFQEIESNHIIIATEEITAGATKVGQTQPAFPDDDMSAEDRINSSNASIVVDTIDQRDLLANNFNLPNGKLVYVNETGVAYRFDTEEQSWVDEPAVVTSISEASTHLEVPTAEATYEFVNSQLSNIDVIPEFPAGKLLTTIDVNAGKLIYKLTGNRSLTGLSGDSMVAGLIIIGPESQSDLSGGRQRMLTLLGTFYRVAYPALSRYTPDIVTASLYRTSSETAYSIYNIKFFSQSYESISNKVNQWSESPSYANYPSEKLVFDSLSQINAAISELSDRLSIIESK